MVRLISDLLSSSSFIFSSFIALFSLDFMRYTSSLQTCFLPCMRKIELTFNYGQCDKVTQVKTLNSRIKTHQFRWLCCNDKYWWFPLFHKLCSVEESQEMTVPQEYRISSKYRIYIGLLRQFLNILKTFQKQVPHHLLVYTTSENSC